MDIEMLQYPFMRLALSMGFVLGVLFPLMGVFVVTRGMAFFTDFIAHSAIMGAALGLLIGVEPSVFLIPYSIAMAFLVTSAWGRMPLSRDTVLGVFYGASVAGGVIIISLKGFGQNRLMQFLFGDILLVGSFDILLALGLLILFSVFLWFNLRLLVKSSFLPDMAQAEGISVKGLDYVLIASMAVAIALSIKMTGAVLANAMVVIPAATAKTLSRSFRQFMFIAPAVGVCAFIGGITASYYLNLPSGPAVIVSAFFIFLLSSAFRRLL